MVPTFPNGEHVPGPAPSDVRRIRRRARRRAWAITLAASLFSIAALGLVVASLGIAGTAIIVAAARGVQRHALTAPALASPPAALNLDPMAVPDVLPSTIPGTRPAQAPHGETTTRTDADAPRLAMVAASSDPLAGPRLIAAVNTTLVRRDIDGAIVMPEPNPAEAALRLISLDEGSSRAINAALNIRGNHLDRAVIINLPFIIVAQSGQAGANKPVVAAAVAIALARSREFFALDDLEFLIASQLPAVQRSHYRALLADFWREYALDAARERAAKGQDPAPESLLIAEAKLKLLGEEAARSFERTVRSGDLLYYWFSRRLGLSPAQAERFRAALAAYAQEHGADGDSAAKRALLDELRQGLTRTQQRTLEGNMKGFLD